MAKIDQKSYGPVCFSLKEVAGEKTSYRMGRRDSLEERIVTYRAQLVPHKP